MKINDNREVYEGLISNQQVNDNGNSNDYALSIDYDIIESIFWKYEGRRVRLIVESMDN